MKLFIKATFTIPSEWGIDEGISVTTHALSVVNGGDESDVEEVADMVAHNLCPVDDIEVEVAILSDEQFEVLQGLMTLYPVNVQR